MQIYFLGVWFIELFLWDWACCLARVLRGRGVCVKLLFCENFGILRYFSCFPVFWKIWTKLHSFVCFNIWLIKVWIRFSMQLFLELSGKTHVFREILACNCKRTFYQFFVKIRVLCKNTTKMAILFESVKFAVFRNVWNLLYSKN
jgi:hypothetical protein